MRSAKCNPWPDRPEDGSLTSRGRHPGAGSAPLLQQQVSSVLDRRRHREQERAAHKTGVERWVGRGGAGVQGAARWSAVGGGQDSGRAARPRRAGPILSGGRHTAQVCVRTSTCPGLRLHARVGACVYGFRVCLSVCILVGGWKWTMSNSVAPSNQSYLMAAFHSPSDAPHLGGAGAVTGEPLLTIGSTCTHPPTKPSPPHMPPMPQSR